MSRPVVFITGAGKRLGRQLALCLADEGYDLLLHYRKSFRSAQTTKKDTEKKGVKTLLVQADLRRVSEIRKMVRQGVDFFGNIDVLINNAAVFPDKKNLFDITESDWNHVLDTNLRGTFFCAQEVARIMMRKKKGIIINIASIGAFSNWTYYIPYCISKAGVVNLTRIMAKSLSPHIRVNAIAPGFLLLDKSEKKKFPAKENILLKKYGNADDIYKTVRFIMENPYLNGQIITVDGGYIIK